MLYYSVTGIQGFKQKARLFHHYVGSMRRICFFTTDNRPLKTKLDTKKEENTGNSGNYKQRRMRIPLQKKQGLIAKVRYSM